MPLVLSPISCYLRAVIKLASPVKNVPIAINSSMSSLIAVLFFFCFFLPICFSPPYVYIISYGTPYVNIIHKKMWILYYKSRLQRCFKIPFLLHNRILCSCSFVIHLFFFPKYSCNMNFHIPINISTVHLSFSQFRFD